ncbi:hypothetical protein OF377_02750 [Ureaplasma sp. ES3154-GEN]|uniref:DUF6856 family protein n=1 Tax=Ureaplasma sp. ES3154-GEN TaxID=2984844 RepID=UPI0021E9733C|nr:hypothetical protein [Ureaplasma sp. ES3154-GEN]MCV3743782.1 hypothetical protein [Ureaplasma sp. ES3154-GEN]
MKKGILISTAVLAAVAGIVTTTSFVVLKSKTTNYAKFLNPNTVGQPLVFTSLKNTKATLHEVILGTNKINNGNYVLYIGTQANMQHLNFIYDNEINNISSIQSLKNNPYLKFNGALSKVLKNLQEYKDEYDNPPQIVSLIDVINDDVFKQEQTYKETYERYSQSSIATEKRWANNASATYVFDPQASYQDIDKKTVFYRQDNQAYLMRETLNYLKDFIGANEISDLNNPESPGIILFYRKNQIKPQVYNLSKPKQNSQQPSQPNSYPNGKMPWNSNNKAFGGEFNAAVGSIYQKSE